MTTRHCLLWSGLRLALIVVVMTAVVQTGALAAAAARPSPYQATGPSDSGGSMVTPVSGSRLLTCGFPSAT
jgi:hypothetical protein